jgi:hypothetical protein
MLSQGPLILVGWRQEALLTPNLPLSPHDQAVTTNKTHQQRTRAYPRGKLLRTVPAWDVEQATGVQRQVGSGAHRDQARTVLEYSLDGPTP